MRGATVDWRRCGWVIRPFTTDAEGSGFKHSYGLAWSTMSGSVSMVHLIVRGVCIFSALPLSYPTIPRCSGAQCSTTELSHYPCSGAQCSTTELSHYPCSGAQCSATELSHYPYYVIIDPWTLHLEFSITLLNMFYCRLTIIEASGDIFLKCSLPIEADTLRFVTYNKLQ